MATIEMSPTFVTGYTSRMISLNEIPPIGSSPAGGYTALGGATWAGLLSDGGRQDGGQYWHSQTTLNLMMGAKPTNFASIPTWESRSADIIMSFSPANAMVAYSGNVATISTSYVNSTSSGLVTWFWLISRQYNWYTGLPANAPLIHQTMGTVGLPGTGSDLELQDTNLVVGQPYRILNLGLRFPTSWTF